MMSILRFEIQLYVINFKACMYIRNLTLSFQVMRISFLLTMSIGPKK